MTYDYLAENTDRSQGTTSNASIMMPTEAEALAFLLPLSSDYPEFERWFLMKVVPGLRSGTRSLVRVERSEVLVGVGIAKNDEIEQKICTVRIASSHFGRGLGLKVFDSLLRWLDVDKPHLTVSEKKLPAFERIFDYYGFKMTSAHMGRYVPEMIEFSYNEEDQLGNSGHRAV